MTRGGATLYPWMEENMPRLAADFRSLAAEDRRVSHQHGEQGTVGGGGWN